MASPRRRRLGMAAFRWCLPLAGLALTACGRSMVPLSPDRTQPSDDSRLTTQTLQAQTPVAESGDYMVVWAPAGGLIPVRDPAGTQGAIVDNLHRDQRGLRLTGRTAQLGSSNWVEILRPGGGTGWVNAWNLTPDVSTAAFCADSRAAEVIDRLRRAVSAKDEIELAGLISPRHGLVIRMDWWNPEIVYSPELASQVFRSSEVFDWGTEPGTGATIHGTFPQVALPALQSGLGSDATVVRCNHLVSGETGRQPEWPGEYANLNFYSVYTPASPIARFSWRTWAVGVEYVGGAPFIVVLVRYRGEI